MKRVNLIQSERSGIFVLPDGITFDDVMGIYADDFRIASCNYNVLIDQTSVDITSYHPLQHEVFTADVREAD